MSERTITALFVVGALAFMVLMIVGYIAIGGDPLR
jgi:hypothetical protein